MNSVPWSVARAFVAWIVLLAGCVGLAGSVRAQPDPDDLPGRVGRVSGLDGAVWLFDDERGRWSEVWRNQAITQGDRLRLEAGSRLQLDIGSTEMRLDGASAIGFERLDDERIVVRLEDGSLALRVRSRDIVRELEVQAGRAWLRPLRTGHYRFDVAPGLTTVTAWRGSIRVETRDQRLSVDQGRSVQLMSEGRDTTVVTWGGVELDAFSDWVARDEQRDDVQAARGHVSPEMTGAGELDRNGRWEQHPELGIVWIPMSVAIDWAPFRHGRWTWHVRWGWTWIDDAPWGFATSHYGRWLLWGGRWVWAPGSYVARPVYAPALVAWIGGGSPGLGISVGIGGAGTIGWYPLGPRDPYLPAFRHPKRYVDRVNQPHLRPGLPASRPAAPIRYGNEGVPQAVTVVPSDVLRHRQPVAPALIGRPGVPPVAGRPTVPPGRVAPPVVTVPGGAVPVPRHGERHPTPEDPHGGSPRVLPVPGGAVPAPSIGPGFSPAPPARPAPPRDFRPPVPPPAAVQPPPPVQPMPPAPQGRGVTPPPREPGDSPRMRHTPPPSSGSVAPAPPLPRVEPSRDGGREVARDRPAPERVDRPDRQERPERRDNARERAERQ